MLITTSTLQTESEEQGSTSPRSFTLVIVICCIASFVAVGLSMADFSRISQFDEETHLSYVVSLQDGSFPTLGEPYSQEVLREFACRRAFVDSIPLPRCGSAPFDPGDFPYDGVQRNSTPPLYYAITSTIAQLLESVTDMSTIIAARWIGVLFLTLFLVGMADASAVNGLDRLTALMVIIPFSLSYPPLVHSVSTVNPDGAVLAIGGVAVAVASRYWRGLLGFEWLIVLAAVAASTKETAIFPIVAVSVVVLMKSGLPLTRRFLRACALGAVTAAFTIGWRLISVAMAPRDFTSPIGTGNARTYEGWPVDEIASTIHHLLPPVSLRLWSVPFELSFPGLSRWVFVLALTSTLAAVLEAARGREARSFVLGLVAAALFGVMLIQVNAVLAAQAYAPVISARYGLGLVGFSLLPMVLVVSKHERAALLFGGAGTSAFVLSVL